MKDIVQIGERVLRDTAQEVPLAEIESDRIQEVITTMKEVLSKEKDGAALAAPQIGISLRIFVLAENVFGTGGPHELSNEHPHLVYINPVIVKRSGKKAVMDEGCLSVRGKYGNVKRSTNVTIQAYDEYGNVFTRGAGGLLAQAYQHECDHLDGRLFVDAAEELWDVDIPQVQTNEAA